MGALTTRSADVCVIGGGVIGRCAALALVARGVRVDLVSRDLPGASSRAAAGLLVPSIEGGSGAAHDFGIAARDLYPEFLYSLRSSVGARIEFNRAGILEVALDEADEQRLRDVAARRQSSFLTPNEISTLEPRLTPTRGGVLAELDGYVDNVALMDALEAACGAARPRLREIGAVVSRVELSRDAAALVLELGERVHGASVVLAAGAWAPTIGGLPRPLPVRPLKGQMISYDPPAGATGALIEHAIYGAGVYLAPRGGRRTLVGATSEEAGFDPTLTSEAAQGLERGVTSLLPQLRTAVAADHWAGLRPMSFDAMPILGTDPEFPALMYACGHSRNGILKAPLTGEIIASLFTGDTVRHDLTPFSPVRHQAATTAT